MSFPFVNKPTIRSKKSGGRGMSREEFERAFLLQRRILDNSKALYGRARGDTFRHRTEAI